MNIERDKYLTEAMGECWHEFDENSPERTPNWCGFSTQYSGFWNVCTKCGKDCIEDVANNQYFDTWQGFGKLWEWSRGQSWWNDFTYYLEDQYFSSDSPRLLEWFPPLINPDLFAEAVYNYLKERTNELP